MNMSDNLISSNLNNVNVCFFHIEKCMGSSLRRILYNYFKNIYDGEEIFLPEKYNNEYNLVSAKDFEFLNNKFYKVLLCHCNYNDEFTNSFSKNCFSITCVRNPIDRILSHYYFFNYSNEQKPLNELPEDKIKNYIEKFGSVILLRLSGKTMELDIAFDNIKNINCILVFENIKTDLEQMNLLLNDKFNLNIKIENIIENETKINYNLFKEKDIGVINKHLDLIQDIKIYEFGRKI